MTDFLAHKHPYEFYIFKAAERCRDRNLHEPQCETLQPYKVPTGPSGETYDVYVAKHCNCWLTETHHTTEQLLTICRRLSHSRSDLHSPACKSFKTEPITYRGKPETLHFACDCWLSVDMPEQPEYTRPETTPTTKGTMTDLAIALYHGKAALHHKDALEKHLKSHLQDFITFQTSRKHAPEISDPEEYNFLELHETYFYFETPEIYRDGYYSSGQIELPHAFIEDPASYKAEILKEDAERAEAQKNMDLFRARERVERLKNDLAQAEKSLAAAEISNDPIKTVASRLRAQELRAQFMTEDMGA